MITYKELIKHIPISDIPLNHQHNLEDLLKRINIVREKYGKPMIVTSGYRTLQDHLRIYGQKGITDSKKIPMGSKHLSGQAVDILDSSGELYQWCKDNESVLETAGVYCEEGTVGWMHFQSAPPKSRKRWFLP